MRWLRWMCALGFGLTAASVVVHLGAALLVDFEGTPSNRDSDALYFVAMTSMVSACLGGAIALAGLLGLGTSKSIRNSNENTKYLLLACIAIVGVAYFIVVYGLLFLFDRSN